MYQLILILHIFGALISFTILALAVRTVLKGAKERYKGYFHLIMKTAVFQITTGVLLFVLQISSSSLLRFCLGLGLYLALFGFVEAVLYFKIYPKKRQFLAKFVLLRHLLIPFSYGKRTKA